MSMLPTDSQSDAYATEDPPRRRWAGPVGIVVSILAVSLALVVGLQIISVLYAVLFPLTPPVPQAGVNLLDHSSAAYGVDEWLYGTQQDPCEVLAFYQQAQSQVSCRVAPGQCNAVLQRTDPLSPSDNIGSCTGAVYFSEFAMSWSVVIAGGYRDDSSPTQFRVSREVYWLGDIPDADALQEAQGQTNP